MGWVGGSWLGLLGFGKGEGKHPFSVGQATQTDTSQGNGNEDMTWPQSTTRQQGNKAGTLTRSRVSMASTISVKSRETSMPSVM